MALHGRFKYHKMYQEITKINYCDIKKISNFNIIDKDNKDNEKDNYTFIIQYKDELMMTKINLNKYQLKFFLSLLKIHKVKCNVDFIKNVLI